MLRRLALLSPLVAAAAAACAAPAAPPTRPVHVVFFTEDSASLDPAARAVVADAAADARRGGAPVRVLGFAGPSGSTAFNRALSETRARSVADALVEAGVPRAQVAVAARGETAFQDIATESRRVEIRLGAQ